MSTRKYQLVGLLVAGILLMALGSGPGAAGVAQAQPAAQKTDQAGVTIPYSGQLNNAAGLPATGVYAFRFRLYATETGSEPLWSEAQENVTVSAGKFNLSLGSVNPIPAAALDSGEQWLEVAVRGPRESNFTVLEPRQHVVSAPADVPAAPAAGTGCVHDHYGEYWTGTENSTGLRVENNSLNNTAIQGEASNGVGSAGVTGLSLDGYGVRGYGINGVGVVGSSNDGIGVWAFGQGDYKEEAALRAENIPYNPLVSNNGIAGYFLNNSSAPTAEFDQSGSGRVLDLQNNGTGDGSGSGDFIIGYGKNDEFRFRVGGKGDFWTSDGYYTASQDFAELLPAVNGLEPGDVLVIGLDGMLARSTQAYQTSVVGVYSTKPGFVGGQPAEGARVETAPLAILGVVPVKVSAENGPIQPGDLLVSASLSGYAMQAGSNPAQGTVIGKALAALDAGQGVILVLVTLQ